MNHYLGGMSRTGQRMTADERRESVLEAALVEFAARGLDGTSTEHVAHRAGISQPYLFRLFPTKKALFIAVVEEALDAMGHAYEKLLEDRTLLLLQMHAYAASNDPEIRAATRAGIRRLWLLVERMSGLGFERVTEFFAMGMLMNVAAALDLPAVDERLLPIAQRGDGRLAGGTPR
jgi:AcrR family transcriptional regulator